jgi:hypothetical protein
MSLLNKIIVLINLITFPFIIFSGCSSRYETSSINQDSTIVYAPKDANGINARITFCKKLNTKTNEPINEGTVFTIKKDAKVYAFVNLENKKLNNNHGLMFHIDWIEPDGNSFFKKRIDLLPDNPTQVITSAISVPPGKRDPGNYALRVYLFRELIAEKKFMLKAASNDSAIVNLIAEKDSITAKITLCEKLSRKSGKRINSGTVFTIKKKAKVHAVVDLKIIPINQSNMNTLSSRSFTLYTDWIGSDGKSFYRKKIVLSFKPSITPISSTISIAPAKRQPGNYIFRVYLLNKLLSEKNFVLKKADKVFIDNNKKRITSTIKTKIDLCKKINKKTGKLIGEANVFTIKKNARVHAIVNINNLKKYSSKKLKFYFDWVGPDDSTFYKKKIDLTMNDSSTSIKSSISITPKKRQEGNYKVRLYLSNKLLAEKDFKLETSDKDSTKNKQ